VLKQSNPALTTTGKGVLQTFSKLGEIRKLQSSKERRRFILLSNDTSLILGMSFNSVFKNEVAHLESDKGERSFFDAEWSTAQKILGF
jgi:hypothetical protein